jgi:hypothetical protein
MQYASEALAGRVGERLVMRGEEVGSQFVEAIRDRTTSATPEGPRRRGPGLTVTSGSRPYLKGKPPMESVDDFGSPMKSLANG